MQILSLIIVFALYSYFKDFLHFCFTCTGKYIQDFYTEKNTVDSG